MKGEFELKKSMFFVLLVTVFAANAQPGTINIGIKAGNRYKESVKTSFLDMKTALSVCIGKKIKISNQSIALEFKYLFHLNDIEYEKMGRFSNREFQLLFAIPLLKMAL